MLQRYVAAILALAIFVSPVVAQDVGTIQAVIQQDFAAPVQVTAPTSGQVLTYSSTLRRWVAGTGAPPSGAAGGDLGGTYPNPTVVSVAHVTGGTLALGNGGTSLTTTNPQGDQVLAGTGTGAAWTSIASLVSGTTATLQTSYNGGATIAEAGAVPVAISSTTSDNASVFTITKNPAGAQSGAGVVVTMGATTSGNAITVTDGATAGAGLSVSTSNSGATPATLGQNAANGFGLTVSTSNTPFSAGVTAAFSDGTNGAFVSVGNGWRAVTPIVGTLTGTNSANNGTTGGPLRVQGGHANQDADGGGDVRLGVAVVGSGTTTQDVLTVSATNGNVGINTTSPGAFNLDVNGTMRVQGKLTVFGALDPTSLILSGASSQLYVESSDGSGVGVAPAGKGRFVYDNTVKGWRTSSDGGALTTVVTAASISGSAVTSLTGTANQVIASAATGAVTLSLPQSIGTGSSPAFAAATLTSGLTLTGATVTGAPTWSSSQAITLSTAAQPNITSVGTLAGLTMTGTLAMSGTPVISGSPASTLGATTVTTLGTNGASTLAGGVVADNVTSTTALTVNQTGGATPALTVDTANSRVGVAGAPGAFNLDVTGTERVTGLITAGGGVATVDSSTGVVSLGYTTNTPVSANGVIALANVNGTLQQSVNGAAWAAISGATPNLGAVVNAGNTVNGTSASANLGWTTGGTYAAGTAEIRGPTDAGMFETAGSPAGTGAGQAHTVTGGAGHTTGAGGLVSAVGGAAAGSNQNAGGFTADTGASTGTGTATILFNVAPHSTTGSGSNASATLLTLANAGVKQTTSTATNNFKLVGTGSDNGTTSTAVYRNMLLNPTINYTAASATGHYEALAIQAVETTLPVPAAGANYLIRASAGAAGTTDEFLVDNAGNTTITGTLTVGGAAVVGLTTISPQTGTAASAAGANSLAGGQGATTGTGAGSTLWGSQSSISNVDQATLAGYNSVLNGTGDTGIGASLSTGTGGGCFIAGQNSSISGSAVQTIVIGQGLTTSQSNVVLLQNVFQGGLVKTGLSTTTNATTTFATLGNATADTGVGCTIHWTVQLVDAAHHVGTVRGVSVVSAGNQNGTVQTPIVSNLAPAVFGTATYTLLTAVVAATAGANVVNLRINPTWTAGSPTSVQITYEIVSDGIGLIAPQ